MKEFSLSVIIPALNEENGLPRVLDSLEKILSKNIRSFEIIVVNDGSTDRTAEAAAKFSFVKVLYHEKPNGYGKSLADGIDSAHHDHILILDADDTYRADDLVEMLKSFNGNNMVVGWRTKIVLPNAKLPKSFARSLLHALAGFLTGIKIRDLNSGYRLFPRDLYVKHKRLFPKGFSFTTTLTLLAYFTGRPLHYTPIEYAPRVGTTKVHYFWDGLRVALWMIRLTIRFRPAKILLPLIILAACVVRLMGINFGLPGTFYADEPHHINVALNFSTGDLNPHIFKYPTLWMYVLSVAFGFTFLVWSGLGILHSAHDFAVLFVWNPSLVYLTARTTTLLFSLLSIWVVFHLVRLALNEEQPALIAAALMAFSLPLIDFGQQAKPDMLMIFLSSLAWLNFTRFEISGQSKSYLLGCLFVGLAISTQYTALLLSPLIFWALLMRWITAKERPGPLLGLFIGGIFVTGIFFLLGTPFSILDSPTFLGDFREIIGYGGGQLSSSAKQLGFRVFTHFFRMGGSIFWGLILFLGGLSYLLKTQKGRASFFLIPLLWMAFVLGRQNEQAGVINYSFCAAPVVFLILGASWGYIQPYLKSFPLIILSIAIFLGPGMFKTISRRLLALQPDSRVVSAEWITNNIPPNEKILIDQAFASPPLSMNAVQVERLYEKTKASDHPRQRYFELMKESHLGGGYEIFRIKRTPKEMVTLERHADWSQSAFDSINVEEGLEKLKEAGISTVVLSSFGATPDNSPRLAKFFAELSSKGTLEKEFLPASTRSPRISVYTVPISPVSNAKK